MVTVVISVPDRTARPSAYLPPDPQGLASEIVEGKRELDRLTDHTLFRSPPSVSGVAAAQETPEGRFTLSRSSPLPLPEVLSHRQVDDVRLWIAVDEGAAIVMDEEENEIFLRLRQGVAPADLANVAGVHALVGRLAAAGFIRGVEGYTDVWRPQPRRFMRAHLTQRCNLSCIHCYADSSPQVSTAGQMTPAQWKKVIGDFADAGGERILFTGGEALVYQGCTDLLRLAHERGLHVTLFSNGILVPENIESIRQWVNEVQISIDGPDAATNDPIRGKASFRRAVAAVDCLVEAGVRVRVGVVVMERNWQALRAGFMQFIQRWDGRGVEFRLGFGLTHHGRGDDLEDELDIRETRPVVESMMEAIEGGPGSRIARKTKGCGYAEQIVVASDGSVHPCHLLDGAVTHIEDQSMEALIGVLEGVAQEYDVDHNIGCNRCDIRNLCGGTCRVQNGKATGNRRITNCTANDKLQRLRNLVRTFSQSDSRAVPAGVGDADWE